MKKKQFCGIQTGGLHEKHAAAIFNLEVTAARRQRKTCRDGRSLRPSECALTSSQQEDKQQEMQVP
jgi:hypothetical protein